MKKRVLSLLMAVLMLASLLPTAAMADGEPAAEENKAELVEKLEEPKEENLEEPKEEELSEAPMLTGATPEGTAITQASFTDGALSISQDGTYYLGENVTGNITVPSGVTATLDLNGKVLKGTGTSSVIFINGGTLSLKDSAPKAKHSGSYETLPDGGVITGGIGYYNQWIGCLGGGVYVTNSGTFNMYGGTITDCKADKGSGVYIEGIMGSTFSYFNMYGGTITKCSANGYVGIGFWSDVNIYDGIISSGTDDPEIITGSGIELFGGPVNFMMEGGTITGFHVNSYGGGLVFDGVKLNVNIKGGTIENCSATGNGGGVYFGDAMYQPMSFTMTGGTITNCSAKNGGGIYVAPLFNKGSVSFLMTGGTITNCSATENGGGIYLDPDISTIGGTATIIGNTAGATHAANNLYLPTGKTVGISTDKAPVAKDESKPAEPYMLIGVTLQNGIGNVTAATNKDYSRHFTSDNPNYKVKFVEAVGTSGQEGYVPAHLELAEKPVCKNTRTATEYKTIAAALSDNDNLNAGDTIQLLKDTAEQVEVAQGQNIILDLNGKTIDNADDGDTVRVRGTLTVTDSSEDGTGAVIASGGNGACSIGCYGNSCVTVWGGRINNGFDVDGVAPIITITGGRIKGIIDIYEGTPTVSITGGLFSAQPVSSYIHADYECVDNTDTATKDDYPKMVRLAHTHSFTYSAEGGVITATCSDTDEKCPLTEKKVSVTLSAADAGYTGEAYTGASLDSTAWTAAGLSAPTVKYVSKDGTSYPESETAPTAAGKYTAKITVDTATASVDFVIGAASITVSGVTAYYATLAEAVAAAQTDNVIKLLSDVTVTEGITIDKSFELNLNGKTITYAPTYTKTEYKALFDIKGSAESKVYFTLTGSSTINGPTGEAAAMYDGKAMITVDAYGTLNYSNGTLTCGGSGSDGMYGVYVLNGGTATLGVHKNGPTITSWFACVGTNHDTAPATVNVDNGTFTSLAKPSEGDRWDYFCAPVYAAAAGNYFIRGGTFNGYYGISSRYGDVEQTIEITGGDFSGVTKSAILYDTVLPSASSEAKVKKVTKKATLDIASPDGYFWDENKTLVSESKVAKIGTVYYDTLAEAVAAAQENDTVKLIQNVTVTEGIKVNKILYLGLNGKTITYAPTCTKAAYKSLFTVKGTAENEAFLGISGNGTINGPTEEAAAIYDGKAMITVDSYGSLSFNNGTLTCGGKGADGMYGVYVLNGGMAYFGKGAVGPSITSWFACVGTNHDTAPATVLIQAGTYTSQATPADGDWWHYFCTPVYAAAAGDYTITGGTFNGYYGISTRYGDVEQKVEINGGTFNTTKSAILYDNILPSASSEAKVKTLTKKAALDIAAPDGYFWDENTTLVSTSMEAKITNNSVTVYYDTLAEAVAAAQNKDEIMLLRDLTVTEGIAVEKSITLVLNGKTVTYAPTYTKAAYKSLFTVKGSSEESKAYLTIRGNGIINGPTEEAAANYDGKAMITVDSYGSLLYTNGTLTCGGKGSDGMYGVYVLNGGQAYFGTGPVGPTITSWFACVGTNHDTATATVWIMAGTYTSQTAPSEGDWWDYFCAPVYAAAAGNFRITGGSFNGYYGVSTRYGDIEQTVEINGGTFNATKSAILYDNILPSASSEAKTKTLTKKADLTTLAAPEGWYWKKGASNSDPLTLTAMTTPDTPAEAVEGTHYTITYWQEIINAASGYELATKDEGVYSILSADAKVTPGGTYYVRVKGTESSFPSGWVEFTVKSRPEGPAALTEDDIIRTHKNITILNPTGEHTIVITVQEVIENGKILAYPRDLGKVDQVITVNLPLNPSKLTVKEIYVARVLDATETDFRSYENSKSVDDSCINWFVTTLKSAPAAAPELTLSDCTVTDTAITLPVSGTPNTYEYAIKPAEGDPVWSDTYEYTALTPATGYTYLIRVKETDDAMPSAVKELTVYTKPVTPAADSYAVDPSTLIVTTDPTTGYEYAVKPEGENAPVWNDIPATGAQLAADVTYLLRVKANGNVPASEAIEFQTKFTVDITVTGTEESGEYAWTGEAFDYENILTVTATLGDAEKAPEKGYTYSFYPANDETMTTDLGAPTAVGAYKAVVKVAADDPLYTGTGVYYFTILPVSDENEYVTEVSYDKELDTTLTLVSSADFSTFVKVTVQKNDEQPGDLPKSNYDAVSGSIIVTLHQDYLQSLEAGTYTFSIISSIPGTADKYANVDYIVTIEECEYEKKIELKENGTYSMKLSGNDAGKFVFTKSGSGWTIQNPETGEYLAYVNGKVVERKEAFVWSYNGGFYTPVTTTRRVLFIFNVQSTANYYLNCNAAGSFSASASYVAAELTQTGHSDRHHYVYRYVGGEKHEKYCSECEAVVETVGCDYDVTTHKCKYCGHLDPDSIQYSVTITKVKAYNSNFLTRVLHGSYTYTAVGVYSVKGDSVTKVEYSLDGKTFTPGHAYSAYKDFDFYLRLTTASGAVSVWKYQSGKTVRVS